MVLNHITIFHKGIKDTPSYDESLIISIVLNFENYIPLDIKNSPFQRIKNARLF